MPHQDLTYAGRRLLKSPGFSLVAVLTLALGIGANTAIFSLVNAVLVRGLPVRAPQELVEVYTSESDGYPYSTSSYFAFTRIQELTEVFSGVVGSWPFGVRVDLGDRPTTANVEMISWDFFQVLGVPLALGRSFLPEEDETPGTHPVVILGYRTWDRDFGRDPKILGNTVRLKGIPFTVVGVAPASYTGTIPVLGTAFYTPLMMANEIMGGPPGSNQLSPLGSRSMFVKARLRPEVTVEQANQALAALSRRLTEEHPRTTQDRAISALPSGKVALHPFVDRILRPAAALLLTVVGLVLLIVCTNLASFLLARAEDRRTEIAIRLALGASRGLLVRQLLVESALLAVLGGAAGILLAHWTLQLLLALQPPLPLPVALDLSLDRTVLAFTAGVTLLATFAFGLLPALQATRPDVGPTLKDGGGGTGRPRRRSLRHSLVVLQVALSFVLLIGAGLFVRSLQKARAFDLGFYTGPAAIISAEASRSDTVAVRPTGQETPERLKVFYREALERLLAHPSIDGVALANRLPLGASVTMGSYLLPGVVSESPGGTHAIDNTVVAPGYFEVMEVPILRGRSFREEDLEGEPVVVVSQAFVDRYYPGEDVVGRTIERGGGQPPLRIIGVAANTTVRTLGEAPRPYVYEVPERPVSMRLVIRGRGSGEELLHAARRVLDQVDPNLVYSEAKTMDEHLALLFFPPRMAALFLSVFGGLALLLSAVGIYGVVNYAVARRTRELGIRMALGATARDVVALAVGSGMRLVAMGGTVGMILAGCVTWAIAGYLYGIGSTDLLTFAAIAGILSGVAFLAALVPARRATRVDPVVALRAE